LSSLLYIPKTSTLFFCGHFGRATPASRRLNRQTLAGLGILAATAVVVTMTDAAWPRSELLLVPGVGLSAAWILLAYRRYFAALDELSLRIQYEAVAFAFAAALFLGMLAGTVAAVTDGRIHPLWIVLAEPLRGVGLVLAARKYR
jgi:hypothetical protein